MSNKLQVVSNVQRALKELFIAIVSQCTCLLYTAITYSAHIRYTVYIHIISNV